MAKIYIDKDGKGISKGVWRLFRDDESYRVLRQFKNELTWITLEWTGVADILLHPFASTYPLFEMRVANASSDGMRWVNDPVEDRKTYHNQQAAIEAYNNFLVRWTESKVEDGELVEVGNELTPPPPPDPNIPKTAVNDDIGCW